MNSGATVLTVTPGDTIHFKVEWGTMGVNSWHMGWVIPDTREGFLAASGGWSQWHWDSTSFGFHMYHSDPFSSLSGLIAEIADSTYGGGYLKEWSEDVLHFIGEWDASGHGSWWSATLGSGNW